MKSIAILMAALLISWNAPAAETLSFRFYNPRIEYFAPDNYLVFEVQMKCTANGTYLYSSQVICNVDIANINTSVPPSFLPGFVAGTFFKPPVGPTYDRYTITTNWNSNNLNIAVVHNFNIDAYFPASYNAVTTSWQTLGTVYATLSGPALTGIAGISFQPPAMDGYQKYATWPSASAYYNSPNLYIGNDLSTLYMGRIYSSGSAWTQWGGTLDWTTAVNTSVWDTAAASPSISNTGSKAAALRIHPGVRLNILPAKDLTCTGNTEINEPKGLILGADATGPGQFLDNGTITYNTGGSVYAGCYFEQEKWHYYCIPVTTTNAWPYLNMYMKYYQEPDHTWKYVVNPDTLLNIMMKGYAMWADQTNPPLGNHITWPLGTLNTGAMAPITVTRNDGTDGYNLIGNPYPSAIDLSSAGVSWGADIDQKAWFWNPLGTGNYFVYIKAGGGTHSQYAPPQQGFFVHHSTANTNPATFTVNNTCRTTTLTEPFRKESLAVSDLLYLTATSATDPSYDMASVFFRPEATTGYDDELDAEKFWGGNTAPQLYSIIPGPHNLTVNAVPWTGVNQVVPLGFTCGIPGTFTLSATNTESFNLQTNILLEDRLLNKSQDLRINPEYLFSYAPGDDPERFHLHFTNMTFGIPDQADGPAQIYSFEGTIYIKSLSGEPLKGEVRIYDLAGQEIYRKPMDNTLLNTITLNADEGYYLVKAIAHMGVSTRKVYLN
jgi:hypothetical protein